MVDSPAMSIPSQALQGLTVVLTRPAGTAAALARQVRSLGGQALLLPGLSLRPAGDPLAVRRGLRQALHDDVLIFSSPAAVRYAARLMPLHSRAIVLAVGQATARVLQQFGLSQARAPLGRQDSEALLDDPALQALHGTRVSLIGAAAGRDLLRRQLLARGAQLRQLHVYQRQAPRLDRRHADALYAVSQPLVTLISSAEALGHLQQALPPAAWQVLQDGFIVVSSQRLQLIAQGLGFTRIVQAASALSEAMLRAAAEVPRR